MVLSRFELDTFFSSTKPYWGAAATIDDCFDAEIVDDGVCSVTEFVLEDVKYYYWLARFGGNASGVFIVPRTGTNAWDIVAKNDDESMSGDVPEELLERLCRIVEKD